jgi:LmbE family N-acetylglucosaminyl deacetylase
MALNVLDEAIRDDVPLIVLSPHLDDAALSCGALMMHAVQRTSVTVVTLFTEGGERPYTLSGRRYLHQMGARSAQVLYQQRRTEDHAAWEPFGIRCVHAGLTDALFRRRVVPGTVPLRARMLPELAHVYPTYRMHVIAGHIAAADAGTLRDVCDVIQRLVGAGTGVLLAPLGVGGHVDHVLVRSAAEGSGSPVVYYSDVPYNRRHPVHDAFIRRNGLVETRWSDLTEAKAKLVRAYGTQVQALFRGGLIPLVPEVFFSRPTFSRPSRNGKVIPSHVGDLSGVKAREIDGH